MKLFFHELILEASHPACVVNMNEGKVSRLERPYAAGVSWGQDAGTGSTLSVTGFSYNNPTFYIDALRYHHLMLNELSRERLLNQSKSHDITRDLVDHFNTQNFGGH